MSLSRNKNLAIAISGIVIGGLSWLIIAGFAVGSFIISAVFLVLAVFSLLALLRLLDRKPARHKGVVGVAILWVVILNFIGVELVYSELPAELLGISTGKDVLSAMAVRMLLSAAALLGFWFLIVDLKHSK